MSPLPIFHVFLIPCALKPLSEFACTPCGLFVPTISPFWIHRPSFCLMLFCNFFSHLQNSQASRLLVISYTPSTLLFPLLDLLLDFGYIRGYRLLPLSSFSSSSSLFSLGSQITPKVSSHNIFRLEILLKYTNHQPAISRILSISTPSRPRYSSFLIPSPSLHGLYIFSTSRGLVSHFTAHKLRLGGLLLCHIS